MAIGEIPRHEMNHSKAIWATVNRPAPTLEGKFSASFKDFVALCLVKDSKARAVRQLPTQYAYQSHPYAYQSHPYAYQ